MKALLAVAVLSCISWVYVVESAVVDAASSHQVAGAARAFAGSLGSTNVQATRVSKSFEDACLGPSPYPPYPHPYPYPQPYPYPYPHARVSGPVKGTAKLSPVSSLVRSAVVKRSARPVYEEKLANRDIVFVLDTSGSIPQDQFDKAKDAIAVLAESFCPTSLGHAVTTSGNKQISVVLFGSTVNTEVDFSDSARGLGYLQDKILGMKHRREGATATGDALTYVKNKVLGKGSSRLYNGRVSTDVIVITDGQCNRNCRVLGSEAENIRRLGHGVNVFAMGVANARACELEIITGKGNNLAYGLGDFQNFDRFAQAVKEIALGNESIPSSDYPVPSHVIDDRFLSTPQNNSVSGLSSN